MKALSGSVPDSSTKITPKKTSGKKQLSVRMLADMAMMLTVIITLAILENMLPPVPMLPPGVRLGLSNIAVMYTLFFLGRGPALTLAVLKSIFVLLTRGVTAGIMSISGGLLSIIVLILLIFVFKNKAFNLLLSMAGAISHNLAQVTAASFILGYNILYIYWPVLLVSGLVMGSVTGILLRIIMPHLHRIFKNNN